jgi:hypothetical protein
MVTTEHTLSEFLQHPTKVTKELARGPIALQRRGAEDLVVMTRGQNGTLETAARLFATVATQGESGAAGVLPWLAFLSARDRKECLRELAAGTSTAMATGRLDLLRDTLYAWEATGLAAWDLRNRRGDPAYRVEAPVPVRRPR